MRLCFFFYKSYKALTTLTSLKSHSSTKPINVTSFSYACRFFNGTHVFRQLNNCIRERRKHSVGLRPPVNIGKTSRQMIGYHQKHITPKRLNFPYLLRTKLGFFSRRSRPIRITENYFAQIWNQRIQTLSLKRLYMYVYNRKLI